MGGTAFDSAEIEVGGEAEKLVDEEVRKGTGVLETGRVLHCSCSSSLLRWGLMPLH